MMTQGEKNRKYVPSEALEGGGETRSLEEEYNIPRLTGNIIEIVGNSFCGACHAERADDFQLADDMRMARQKMVEALFPEVKSYEYWCVFKHLCSLIVDSYEQIYKNKRSEDPYKGAFAALKMYLNRAKYVWAAMLTGG